jgi:hypothetical protein
MEKYTLSGASLSVGVLVRMIKTSKMRWVGHVARIGEKRKAYKF